VGTVRPQSPDQFFASDYLARPFEQRGEDLKRLLLQLHADSVFTQLAFGEIGFEVPEPHYSRRQS